MNANRKLFISGLLAACFASAVVRAGEKPGAKKMAGERAKMSIELVQTIMSDPRTSLPAPLLGAAQAVAVFPALDRGEATHRGTGLIVHRLESGEWSSPAFVRLTGMQRTNASDVVLVFTEHAQLGELVEKQLDLGAEASIAAGILGSNDSADQPVYDASVYSYVRNGDVFVGMAIDGISIAIDMPANHAIYGNDFDARACLTTLRESMPEELVGLRGALDRRPDQRS